MRRLVALSANAVTKPPGGSGNNVTIHPPSSRGNKLFESMSTTDTADNKTHSPRAIAGAWRCSAMLHLLLPLLLVAGNVAVCCNAAKLIAHQVRPQQQVCQEQVRTPCHTESDEAYVTLLAAPLLITCRA